MQINVTPATFTNSSPYEENDGRLCYIEARPEECVRLSLMIAISAVTWIGCVSRIVQFHFYSSNDHWRYALFYIGALICSLCILHWSYLHYSIFDLVSTFLINVELLVICYIWCDWLARLIQREKEFKWIFTPICVLTGLGYLLSILVWACITVQKASTECSSPEWLVFSATELVLAQFCLGLVLYITQKLKHVVTTTTNRHSQRFQLWGIAITYEVVAFAVFIYDLYIEIYGRTIPDCKDLLPQDHSAYIIVYIIHKFLKYFLVQWVFIIFISPTKPQPQLDNDSSAGSDEASDVKFSQHGKYQPITHHCNIQSSPYTTTSASSNTFPSSYAARVAPTYS